MQGPHRLLPVPYGLAQGSDTPVCDPGGHSVLYPITKLLLPSVVRLV